MRPPHKKPRDTQWGFDEGRMGRWGWGQRPSVTINNSDSGNWFQKISGTTCEGAMLIYFRRAIASIVVP